MLPLSRRILSHISDVPKEAWNALLGPSPVPTLRWEWLFAMEASGSAQEETGWKPQHLTLWRGDSLVAAAPAYLKFHSFGEYVYDFAWAQAAQQLGVAYYPKLLLSVPLSPLTSEKFLISPSEDTVALKKTLAHWALECAQEDASGVHVLFPRKEELELLVSEGYAPRSSMQYHWKNRGYGTYDDFLSRFDSKRRNQLRRERKAASEQGIAIRTVRGGELTAQHAKLAFGFYEATCNKNAWGQIQLNLNFFERVFSTMPESVEMVLAERNGNIVAGAFNLVTPTHLYGRYWGCFEEVPFLHFHVCLYHSIDDCIQNGRQVFEPGAGGEHKISRGFEPTEIYSAHWLMHAGLDKAIRGFVARERQQLSAVFENALSVVGMKKT